MGPRPRPRWNDARGLAVRFHDAATIALTGALCPGAPGWGTAVTLAAGTVVRLGPPQHGLRS